jgi:hypothetical protein
VQPAEVREAGPIRRFRAGCCGIREERKRHCRPSVATRRADYIAPRKMRSIDSQGARGRNRTRGSAACLSSGR